MQTNMILAKTNEWCTLNGDKQKKTSHFGSPMRTSFGNTPSVTKYNPF
jgi:hypothetical protein